MDSSRLALLFALCLVLALGCLLGIRPPVGVHQGRSPPAPDHVRTIADRPPPDLETCDPPAETTRRPVRTSTVAAARIETIERKPSNADAGWIRIRAIDSESGEPLLPIRVRAASETRIADRESRSGIDGFDIVLSPDSYSLLVLAQGYEPTELAPVSVGRGETVTLEPVRLCGGNARVLGVVRGDLPAEGPCFVELLGSGRRPCVGCSRCEDDEHCATCGYGAASSILAVPAGGRFAFERLASGPYALRLIDDQRRMLAVPSSFDLEPGEWISVELDANRPRSLQVELIDTDGTSLAGEWSERIARAKGQEDAVELVQASAESIRIQCEARVGDFRLAQSSLEPPPLDPTRVRVSCFVSRCCIGRGPGSRSGVDDRHRDRFELLRPLTKPPKLEPDEIPSEIDADGRILFDALPSLEMTLRMTCGPFTATANLPRDRGGHVRARWKRADCRTCTFREFEKGRRP